MGSDPAAPDWKPLATKGAAIHSVDENGYGKWIALSTEGAAPNHQLFEVASPAPLSVRTLDASCPR